MAEMMTQPIRVLEEEHQLINRVLAAIDKEVQQIEAGTSIDVEFIELAVDFFSGFVDKRHHGKEEGLLFPILAAKKEIIRNGPVKVLVGEHESGRYFVGELRDNLPRLALTDTNAPARIHRALSLYARMLRNHIAKEEEIIFLLSQVLLSEQEMEGLEKGFEAYDAALGSKSLEDFTALVERMEARVISNSSP